MNSSVANALSRCFAETRIVFWYDEGGRCRDEFDKVEVEGVEKLVLDGNPFGVKYRILAEKPEGKFLVYSPKVQPSPADDWLYDLYLAGMPFRTDPVSMVMGEMSFPEEARGILTEKRLPFFKSEQRKRDVKAMMDEGLGNEGLGIRNEGLGIRNEEAGRRLSASDIELILISVLCRIKGHAKIEYVLAALLKELSENKTDRIDELAKYGLEPALWKRLGIDYGYQNATNPSVVDFANKLFHDAFYPAIRDSSVRTAAGDFPSRSSAAATLLGRTPVRLPQAGVTPSTSRAAWKKLRPRAWRRCPSFSYSVPERG